MSHPPHHPETANSAALPRLLLWLTPSSTSPLGQTPGNTHVTGLKGRLLRSDCDCSMLIDWFKASSWRDRFGGVTKGGKLRPSPSHLLLPASCLPSPPAPPV